MMRKKYIRIALSAALVLGVQMAVAPTRTAAQDFNPTVEVTNAYEAGHIDANKPKLEMAVPDSVMRFSLDFDYSISTNPYQGSYSFHPYVISVEPESSAAKGRTFYMRLGAGYALNPTFDIVYTPRFKTKSFSMSIYGTHRSYFGKYRNITASQTGGLSDGSVTDVVGGAGYEGNVSGEAQVTTRASSSDKKPAIDWDGKNKYSGYDSYTKAGIYGRADWNTGLFSFDVGYTGYARRDTSLRRSFDMLHGQLRVASRKEAPKYFYYDFSLSYLYGTDNVKQRGAIFPVKYADNAARLREQDISFVGVLGPVFTSSSRLLFDVRFDLSDYESYFDSYSGQFSVTPKYIFRHNRWLLNLGAEFSTILRSDRSLWPSPSIEEEYVGAKMHSNKGQIVYPDVEIGFDAVKSHLNIYLKATGGNDINRYTDMVARNPFLTLNYAWNYAGMPLMDNTVESVNARLGFQGNIASKLSFNLYGGYAYYDGLPLDAVIASSDWSALSPGVSYADCNYYYATLELGWHSSDVTADGYLSYIDTDLSKSGKAGFEPARLKGGFNIVYNWRKRIYVGVHGDAATARNGRVAVMYSVVDDDLGVSTSYLTAGSKCRLPGYFDLALSVEYRFSRAFSIWLYGSNLLNQTIQPAPLYTSSPIAITAGITLTL